MLSNLVQEDEPVPIIIGDGIENPDTCNEEILLSDGWSKESHTSSYKEFSLPAPNDEPANVIMNDSVEGFQFIGTTAVKKENGAVDAQILAREENLPMPSVEEEEEDSVDDDINDEDDFHEENVIEEEEENSEGKFAVEENSPMQEMLLSDDSDEESIAAGDGILCNEDSSLAVPDGLSLDEPENMINNDSGENLQYTETIQVIKDDETVNTDKLVVEEKETEDDSSEEHASETLEEDSQEKLAVDENSATKQVEEEEEEDDDSSEEEATEEEEDSSEGTGSSSMESNVEAIWPAEMIDAPSQGLKDMNVNYQNNRDKIAAEACNRHFVDRQSDGKYDSEERGSYNETTDHSRMILNNKAAQELVTVNDLVVHSSKRRVWIWSMMVILPLLLLLIVHRTGILKDLPYHDYAIVP